MRLPEKMVDGRSRLDVDMAVRMIRYAIDNEVCYIDTARPYHNGDCEKAIGLALKDGYREKTYLVTKLTPWQIKNKEDMERVFEDQVKNLQTQYIDIYLLHYLNKSNWEKFLDLDVLNFLLKKKQQGKIRYIGFSFHDDFELFKEIINYYDWDICQVQMNILDMDNQVTVEGIRYAGKKGIPVVIMEPLKGGRVVKNIPPEVLEIWNSKGRGMTPVEWAFKWLYDFPEVAVILSGAADMEQLIQNIEIFNRINGQKMSNEDLNLIDNVVEAYRKTLKVECTGCNYCNHCPNLVQIPTIFQYYNEASIFKNYKQSLMDYWTNVITRSGSASECSECGYCIKKCPQGLNIPVLLKEAHHYIMNQGNIK